MITLKHFLQSTMIGGCFLMNVALQGVGVSSSNREQEQTRLAIREQVTKINNSKKLITDAHKELILLYHTMGKYIFELQVHRRWNGRKILDQFSKGLRLAFPGVKGFSGRRLQDMCKFAKAYPDQAFVNEIALQLSWSLIGTIMEYASATEEQLFYMKKAIEHAWSRRTLIEHIQADLYKKEALNVVPTKEVTQGLVEGDKKASEAEWLISVSPEYDQAQRLISLNTEREEILLKLRDHLFSKVREQGAKVADLKKFIADTEKQLTLLYHGMGVCILAYQACHLLSTNKALYQISKDIKVSFPGQKGFSARNLQDMRKLAQEYNDEEVCKEIAQKLTWSHIAAILERVRTKEDQLFYIKKDIECGWSYKTLVKHMRSDLHKQAVLEAEKDIPQITKTGFDSKDNARWELERMPFKQQKQAWNVRRKRSRNVPKRAQ
jgi:predicted nuclease of restriction endonuclease-like (RecB) superfamily